jgi:mono/diheme cytochrome c family protein
MNMARLPRAAALATLAVLAAIAGQALAQTLGDSPGGGGTDTPTAVSGAEVYQQICQACHMANAEGAVGAGNIPALAANANLKSVDYPLTVVVKGKGAMPAFAEMLEPAQIAAVVGYVRTNFGNAYPEPVTEAEVKKLIATMPVSNE